MHGEDSADRRFKGAHEAWHRQETRKGARLRKCGHVCIY